MTLLNNAGWNCKIDVYIIGTIAIKLSCFIYGWKISSFVIFSKLNTSFLHPWQNLSSQKLTFKPASGFVSVPKIHWAEVTGIIKKLTLCWFWLLNLFLLKTYYNRKTYVNSTSYTWFKDLFNSLHYEHPSENVGLHRV